MLFPIPFRLHQTQKAIAVNSLLSQLQLAPLKHYNLQREKPYPAFITVQMNIVTLFSYNTCIIQTLYLLAYTAIFRTFISMKSVKMFLCLQHLICKTKTVIYLTSKRDALYKPSIDRKTSSKWALCANSVEDKLNS